MVPPEIWLTVLQNLCLAKRCALSSVCKTWRSMIDISITSLSYEESRRMQTSAITKNAFAHLSHLVAFDGYFDDI